MDKKSIIKEIIELENLHWAWAKAKAFFQKNEYWYDQLEIASFTANYENELLEIINSIQKNTYVLKPITPIFFPKGLDENNKPRSRQLFLISVRDQVVWLAVMNVIGKYYDRLMPFWSYGNRLYISMFPDGTTTDGKIKWGYGNYRNTTTNTYRNFQQSWPRFRKDIHLIAKVMTKKMNALSPDERDDIVQNDLIKDIHQIQYKKSSYWNSELEEDGLYWASIDLTKFFPKCNRATIKRNFIDFGKEIDEKYSDFSRLENLLSNLLEFKIDYSGLSDIQVEDYKSIDLDMSEDFYGIPTALFSAGFLSNIAMLKVDKVASEILDERREIAHFRFVDDHTFLSTNPDKLLDWIQEYEAILHKNFTDDSNVACMQINHTKTKPDACAIYMAKKNMSKDEFDSVYSQSKYESLESLKEAASLKMALDPSYPSVLMNHTLEKMSMINNTPFDLLDSEEALRVLYDLEHLLVTEFPDDEIRKDTRMAFASSRLAQYTSRKDYDFTPIYVSKSNLLKHKAKKTCEEKKAYEELDLASKKAKSELDKEEEKKLERDLEKKKEEVEEKIAIERRRVFNLMLHTIRSHPDKLSVWKNTILFCEKNGFSEMDVKEEHYKNELFELWNLIHVMYKKNLLNPFSYIYLQTFFYDHLSASIIRALDVLSSSPSYRETNRKCSYLKAIFKSDFLTHLLEPDSQIYYFNQSKHLFKITISFVIPLIDRMDIDIRNSIKIDDSVINDFTIPDLDDSSFSDLQLAGKNITNDLIVWNLVEKFAKTSINISPIIESYYSATKIDNNFAYCITSLYPTLINEHIVSILLGIEKTNFFPFPWWYEVFTATQNDLSIKSRNVYEQHLNVKNQNAKLCYEYLEMTKDRTSFLKLIERNESENQELFALKRISQILEDWIKPIEFDLLTLNDTMENRTESFPYNFIFNEKKNLELEKADFKNIIDKRYCPDFINFEDKNNPEKQVIFGIGVLLFQLITKAKMLPNDMYLPSSQLLNTGKFHRELEKYPVSSLTTEIINACLSKRGRETNKFAQNNEEIDDAKFEFKINTVQQLIKLVNKARKQVENEKYIFDENNRYLIPFSLQKLKADVIMHRDDR